MCSGILQYSEEVAEVLDLESWKEPKLTWDWVPCPSVPPICKCPAAVAAAASTPGVCIETLAGGPVERANGKVVDISAKKTRHCSDFNMICSTIKTRIVDLNKHKRFDEFDLHTGQMSYLVYVVQQFL